MTLLEKALAGVVVVLLASTAILGGLWRHAEAETRGAAFHADSLAAALDTSHQVSFSRGDSIKILGDTLQAVGRRVFQVAQQNDALDRAQQLDRKAIASLTAQVHALEVHVDSPAPVVTDTVTGDRSATFPIDSTPYHGSAAVTLPRAGSGRLALDLHIDPAKLGLRLGCGAKRDGIRSASATLTGPPWLVLSLDHVDQDPEICNPTPTRPSFFRRLLSSCGVGPSYAIIRGEDGKIHNGVGAAADCHVWP